VRESLGDGSRFGARLHYVHEPVILGTSGALDNARQFFEDETFVVVNGKIITNIDLGAAMDTHRRTNALATLVLKKNPARERFSVVETENGLVKRFGNLPEPRKLSDGSSETLLMFTGIQILEPRIFDYIPRGVFSHSTTEVYPQAIAKGERVAAHVGAGVWYELSTLQRYLDISLALLKARGRNVDMGKDCEVDPSAEVQESILWNNVSIESGARVRGSVIGDGVQVGPGKILENVVVVRADMVAGKPAPRKALPGRVEGDNFVVPLSQ